MTAIWAGKEVQEALIVPALLFLSV